MRHVVSVLLFLCVLKALNFWMLWGVSRLSLYFCTVVALIIARAFGKSDCSYRLTGLRLVAFFFFSVFGIYLNTVVMSDNATLFSYTTTILWLTILAFVLCFSDAYKEFLVYRYALSFSCLLGTSLIVFFVSLLVPLPYVPTPYYNSFGNMPYGIFKNYFFVIQPTRVSSDLAGLPRFCGPFLEPGQLATFLAFLFAAIGYKYRSRLHYFNCSALLFTFSLAGYLLSFIGLCVYRVRKIYHLIVILGLGSIIWFAAANYNYGDNYLNHYIFERLEYDKDTGIAGNNRSSTITNNLYDERVKGHLDAFMFGVPDVRREAIGGSGIKTFVVRYGVFPIILLLISYLFLVASARNKRAILSYVVIVIFSLLQRTVVDSFYVLFLAFLITRYSEKRYV